MPPEVVAEPVAPEAPPAVAAPAAVTPPEPTAPRTVEDVEAEWQHRVSQKDRGHAAAEKVLRDQIASLEARNSGAPATGSDGQPTADPERARLERELAEERQARVIDQRRVKYPRLAEYADSILGGDEAQLAKLDAALDNEASGGTFIAPTSPRRTAPAPTKPYGDMTADELQAEMSKLAPSVVAEIRSR